MGVVDALVREAKGWGILGIVPAAAVCLLSGGLGWGVLAWALWTLLPILAAFASGRMKDASFAKRL